MTWTTADPSPLPVLDAPRVPGWAPALGSALLALALFAVTLGGTYIYDDVGILEMDKRLTDPSLWWQYWTDSYNDGIDNLYRPLVSMTYAIQWWLHGHRPWAFHLVNWLLHAAVSALVAELARRMAGTRAAWVCGLLFAAHPVHVEAVANIVGRAELICALGLVGALVLYLKSPLTRARAVAIFACFVLSVLSKEQGMLVPLLLLTMALTRRLSQPRAAAPNPSPEQRAARQLLLILLCFGLSAYIAVRESILKFWWDRSFLDWTINPLARPDADRWLMPLVLLGKYTQLLVFPWRLSPDYGGAAIGWKVSFSDPYFWLGAAAIVAWPVLAVFALLRRRPVMLFALLCLAFTYGVIGNLVTIIGTNFGERLMYTPSVFFLLLVALAAVRLPRRALAGCLAVVLLAACWRSFTYAQRWNDRLSFYQTSLREQPKAIRLHMLVASELQAQRRLDEAEVAVRRGRELQPDYWEIWVHSGAIAMDAGKFDEAEAFFNRAMDLKPMMKTQAWLDELAKRRAATRPATQPAD